MMFFGSLLAWLVGPGLIQVPLALFLPLGVVFAVGLRAFDELPGVARFGALVFVSLVPSVVALVITLFLDAPETSGDLSVAWMEKMPHEVIVRTTHFVGALSGLLVLMCGIIRMAFRGRRMDERAVQDRADLEWAARAKAASEGTDPQSPT